MACSSSSIKLVSEIETEGRKDRTELNLLRRTEVSIRKLATPVILVKTRKTILRTTLSKWKEAMALDTMTSILNLKTVRIMFTKKNPSLI